MIEVEDIDCTKEQKAAISTIYNEFNVTAEKARDITDHFMKEMRKGLDHEGATVPMIPSFVTGRPEGNETGKYLALDLGGTNLRVCEFELKGDRNHSVRQIKYQVCEELKVGHVRDLFDFIADCVDNFLFEFDTSPDDLCLGFTFSFPVSQTSINRGTLIQWTKGFSCQEAIGKDVIVLLQDAFMRKNIRVNVVALVNDTVGTLMAHGYRHPETSMGIILGTGTNAAYYEKIKNIRKWTGGDQAFDEMVVNMEWGAFDLERKVLPFTHYDNRLDRQSINPGMQPFEKLISGMYLGEIVRNVILDLIDNRLLFSGTSSIELNRPWRLETAYVSVIMADETVDLEETRYMLEDTLQLAIKTTLADRQIVKLISTCIARRAARLSACGITAILALTQHLGKDTMVAVDGSVYEHSPKFEANIRETLVDLLGDNNTDCVRFALARDGSGLGAAVIAMMSHKASLAQKNLR
ncbi:hexokinase-domain-containing protein [Sporodiniella umbellata]|nr:hexokinase-domain-containing protein [Sporodiniella umbellata]